MSTLPGNRDGKLNCFSQELPGRLHRDLRGYLHRDQAGERGAAAGGLGRYVHSDGKTGGKLAGLGVADCRRSVIGAVAYVCEELSSCVNVLFCAYADAL